MSVPSSDSRLAPAERSVGHWASRGVLPKPAGAETRTSRLEPGWSTWFDDLTVERTPEGDVLLSGPVRDQAALFGLLACIQYLSLILIAVSRQPTSHQTARRLQ